MKGSESRPALDSLRGFWSLFVTQFQGAFSDNVLKTLVVFMLLAMNMTLAERHRISELVGALFALPFILFSMAGGFLADRFSKRTISVGVKVFEILVMVLALAGLMWAKFPILLTCVFLMGAHSAFFGPSKYGLLPELLPEKQLSWGNGLLEFGTYTAIILGIVTAGLMAAHFRGHHGRSGVILIVLAGMGLATSLGISRVPAADPQRKFRANFLGDLFSQMRSWRGDRPLILAVLGNTYFSFLGALLLLNVFFFGANVLKVSEAQISWLSAALAVGVGLGSVTAGYLSGNKIEYGLVPLGAAGLSIAFLLLAAPGLSLWASLARLALLGFAGGFFIVPISALLQHRPDKSKKGEVLASANLLSFVRSVSGLGSALPAGGSGTSISQPDFLFRRRAHPGGNGLRGNPSARLLASVCVMGFNANNLPNSHYWPRQHSGKRRRVIRVQSRIMDGRACCSSASTDRHVRFMMFKGYYELPHIGTVRRAFSA